MARVTVRRFGIGAALAGVLLATAGLLAGPAAASHASVINAGPITIQFSGGTYDWTGPGPTAFQVPGITGTASGTIDALGNFTLPQGSILFNAIPFTLLVPVTANPSASADWTGTIDPVTGAMTLNTHNFVSIDIPLLSTTCTQGPFDASFSSTNAGGVAVDFGTGNGEVTGGFTLPTLNNDGICSPIAVANVGPVTGLPAAATGDLPLNVTFAPPPPTLSLDKTTVAPGGQVTVSGTNYQPASNVALTLNSTPVNLGSATVDGSGNFTTTVTIPANTPDGSHTITATGLDTLGAPATPSKPLTVQSPAPPAPSLTLDRTTVAPGGQITVTGSGFQPGSNVALTLNSTPVSLGASTVDATGKFTATPVIPTSTPPGSHTITASGTAADGSPVTVDASLTVQPALPATGTSVDRPLAGTGAGLVLLGGGLVVGARRRRRVLAA